MVETATKESNIVVSSVGLVKEFRDFWNRPKAKAVNDLDFEVREGEILGLLGPNGSGKSTTVKMLLGLLYPTAGRLTVFGKSPRDVDTKRLIGYLPEESYKLENAYLSQQGRYVILCVAADNDKAAEIIGAAVKG